MKWLEAEPDDQMDGFDDEDIRISIAALFYHMVAVDGQVTPLELARLKQILQARFKLEVDQISAVLKEGKDADSDSAGVFPFAVVLNRELTELERHRVFSQMQALAMADGEVHPLEQNLLNHIKSLLRLNA